MLLIRGPATERMRHAAALARRGPLAVQRLSIAEEPTARFADSKPIDIQSINQDHHARSPA
jgi:hypothetical protein